MSFQSELDSVVAEATARAYEAAMIYYGREPSLAETTLILLQSQLAMLASTLITDESELLAYWNNVVAVIRGGMQFEQVS